MNYSIDGTQQASRLAPVGHTPVSSLPRTSAGAARSDAVHSDAVHSDAVKLDTFPASPPPEVMDEIHAAATATDRLAAANRELQFRADPVTGHLQVEVHDLQGNLLFIAPASTALAVAGGASVR